MSAKDLILRELVRQGYSEKHGKRCWNLANRNFLHLTPALSQGFLNLIKFPPYKKNVYDKETFLIRENAARFIKQIGTEEPFNLIDVGCLDGNKAKDFIRAFKGRGRIRYCPTSPDDYLLKKALLNIRKAHFRNVVEYKPTRAGYDRVGEFSSLVRSSEFHKNVLFLHGSVLASYEINDYLFNLSKGMFSGDFIIIGNGIRTGTRLTGLYKYKHKIFSDWFMLMMKELGFSEDELEYDVRFNSLRIEGFYRVKKGKKISLDGKSINFREGDEILITIFYKYYLRELEKFFKMYFSVVEIVKDKDNEYMFALCRK